MEHLATFAKQFSLEQVPNEVIERAKWMLLDSIAAIAYGNQASKHRPTHEPFEK